LQVRKIAVIAQNNVKREAARLIQYVNVFGNSTSTYWVTLPLFRGVDMFWLIASTSRLSPTPSQGRQAKALTGIVAFYLYPCAYGGSKPAMWFDYLDFDAPISTSSSVLVSTRKRRDGCYFGRIL
jgi:hypothetical protein